MATRAAVGAALALSLAPLATAAGVPTTDTADGFGPALDAAFASIGVVTDSATVTVADPLLPALRVLARYYALETVQTALALRVDVSLDTGAQRKESQLFAQVGALVAAAAAQAQALGYPVAGGGQPLRAGRVRLGYLAPRGGTIRAWH